MNSEQIGAVVYLRVSTKEQAQDPLNLPNQEKTCITSCDRNGHTIVRTFTDPGESGRSADRPEFQKMVAFCKAHRREVQYVIVQDLSRFARNLPDQADAIAALLDCGVRVRSIFEPNVDETAAGILAGNIHGAFNQYFSDALSEKMRDRSRAAALAGRWPWPAPPCYVNVDSKDGANIVPVLASEPLLRRCFELIATGIHTQTDVLRRVSEDGLRNRRGRPLSTSEFNRLLRNPVYAGWVCPPSMPDVRVKGLHRPIVSQELFDRVQDVLDGKNGSSSQEARKPRVSFARPCPLCFVWESADSVILPVQDWQAVCLLLLPDPWLSRREECAGRKSGRAVPSVARPTPPPARDCERVSEDRGKGVGTGAGRR
jgi:DNA invertase Pin-like site-specific DNA recombinase